LVVVVTQLLVMCFGIYVLWAIATIMERNWSVRTPALNMPNIVFYIPITLGIFAMTVLSLLGVWMTISAREEEV
jgi:TRAP-type C4-dicarboxylate transport system permease small subunit